MRDPDPKLPPNDPDPEPPGPIPDRTRTNLAPMSCHRSIPKSSTTKTGQLRQHRIHVRLHGYELILKELHVALVKRCSLRN